MEKRLFYTFFITLLFLISYNYFVSKYYAQHKFIHQGTSSIIEEEKEKAEEAVKELKPESLVKIDTDNFAITLSPRGGYVKTIYLKAYQEELSFKNIGFTPQDKDKEFTPKIEGEKIIFTTPQGEKKEFIFSRYTLTIKLTPFPPSPLLLFSNQLISNTLEQRYQEFFYLQNNNLQRKNFKNIKEGIFNEIGFAGTRDRYYCFSLLKGSYNIKWIKNKEEVNLYLLSSPQSITLYIGPQTEKELNSFGLQGIMYYGFFHGIGVGMIKLLHFFYFLTKNWGISIILLAVFIYSILFPFTMRSTKQMKKMQEIQGIIQPKLRELKEKYKDNPQKIQKETLELYRKYKINPLGGCLPLFFQFPVFIALYQVLLRFIELKGARFLWIKDLSLPDRAFKLPLSLPFLGNYINLLPIFILILSLIQQKFTPSSSSSDQKLMGLFLAVFIGMIFYNFPSCLALYWFIQNLFTLTYQAYIAQAKQP